MSAAEIIAELPRLSSPELAQVQAKLSELVGSSEAVSQTNSRAANSARSYSPRLAHPAKSIDFVKHIVELAPDAKL